MEAVSTKSVSELFEIWEKAKAKYATEQETIIPVVEDEAPPLPSPAFRLSGDKAMTVALSHLVGQPIKSWRPNNEFCHGRVQAVFFEIYPDIDPLLPIPMVDTYPPRFVQIMRDFARHLTLWSPGSSQQRSWFNRGHIIIENVIKSSYRLHLTPDERACFESCLHYALANPTV